MTTLPNNNFGAAMMLLLILLIAVTSFVVPLWLIGMIAPWWVNVPTSLLIATILFLKIVKFKN